MTWSVKSRDTTCTMNRSYDHPTGAGFESDVETPGEERAPAGPTASSTSHVPGTRATGRSQVAVKVIPRPTQNQDHFSND